MMVLVLFFGIIFVCGYVCGLFPSGPWIARGNLGGRHLTDMGSGSTGATNVLRYAGWGRALAVVLLDMMKGVVAILLARYGEDVLALRLGDVEHLAWGEVFAAVGCLSGHCFPLWSKGFRGGKGVASMMGIVVMLSSGLFFVSGLLWLGILAMWGFSSLASLGVCLFLVAGDCLAWGVVFLCGARDFGGGKGVASMMGIVVMLSSGLFLFGGGVERACDEVLGSFPKGGFLVGGDGGGE